MNEHRAQPDLLSPQAVLSRTAHDLAAKYVGVFSAQTVERYVFESYTALRRTAKIHTHLTSLAARFAADRLTALAQSSGALAKDVPEVLFVCVHNAGAVADGGGTTRLPRPWPRSCALSRIRAGPRDQPRRHRGDGRDRDRSGRRVPETAHR